MKIIKYYTGFLSNDRRNNESLNNLANVFWQDEKRTNLKDNVYLFSDRVSKPTATDKDPIYAYYCKVPDSMVNEVIALMTA